MDQSKDLIIELKKQNNHLQEENNLLRKELLVINELFEDFVNSEISKNGKKYVLLDYLPNCYPRYGFGRPPHHKINQILNKYFDTFHHRLKEIYLLKDQLISIPLHPSLDDRPFWINNWMPPIDSATLYSFIVREKPKLFVEIGSGISTKFARHAINTNQLNTTIISIDPQPREEVDRLCDQIIREPVENLDMAFFKQLKKSDILFIDGSHRAFQNSDVTALLLEIIPDLAPGVIVHFHDICWPIDYPPEWSDRFYNEQYILGAYLLAEWKQIEVLQANAFISENNELSQVLHPLWDDLQLKAEFGSSFWFQMLSL